MTFSDEVTALAAEVLSGLVERRWMIITAESCTGGLIAGALTSIAGSSEAVYGGFVTYADAAKTAMVGVTPDTLSSYGAVSEEAARMMAEGAREASGADIAMAVTGIAGPGGGSADKPVGLVHFACSTASSTKHIVERFGDIGREHVRSATVERALTFILEVLQAERP